MLLHQKNRTLKRALAGNEMWITGLRAEQSANREDMHDLEWDEINVSNFILFLIGL